MYKIQKKFVLIVAFVMLLWLFTGCNSSDITGEWVCKGEVVEFLSDGVIFYEGCSDMYPPTYEITEEGYLKIGKYDYAWLAYEYTYFIVENNGDTLTLTDKADTDRIYVLERSSNTKDDVDNYSESADNNNELQNGDEESKDSNVIDNFILTDEEKALAAIDKYFEAYNAMDLQAIHDASYPKGYEMDPRMVCENDYEFFECWRNYMGFVRSRFDWKDNAEQNPEWPIYEDYPMYSKGENGELLNSEGSTVSLDVALPDFSITYEVIEMKPYEECTVYYRSGLEFHEFSSMDEIVHVPQDGETLDIDNMYAAKVVAEYYYGDDLYGYNKDWWNDKTFSDEMGSYEAEIENIREENVLLIYEYEGDWYVYSHRYNSSWALFGVGF